MKGFILTFSLLCLGVVGCARQEPSKQVASVNAETLTLTEADTAAAQPAETNNRFTPPPETNAVMKSETETKAEVMPVLPEVPDGKMIQQALKNLGIYTGEIDGKIGPKTKEAITEFQRRHNLIMDGKVGPKTWVVLKSALETTPAAVSTTSH